MFKEKLGYMFLAKQRGVDDVLTLLVHLGYLAHDFDTGFMFLTERAVRNFVMR